MTFDHFIIRVGGKPFAELDSLASTNLKLAVAAIKDTGNKLALAKETLLTALWNEIQTNESNGHKKTIQNYRRDIYNDRNLKLVLVDSVRALISEESRCLLDEYEVSSERYNKCVSDFVNQYNVSITNSRLALQKYVADKNFLKGLQMSSEVLFGNVDTYNSKNPQEYRVKHFQIEAGLLKYATRMMAKTSPFSAFNTIWHGSLKHNTNQRAFEYIYNDNNTKDFINVQLNNSIFFILKSIIVSNWEQFPQVKVKANPSIIISEDDQVVKFIINNNNIDMVQRVNRNDFTDYVIELVSPAGITVANLLAALQNAVEADSESLKSYLINLIKAGLIEYDLSVSPRSISWVEEVKSLLLSWDHTSMCKTLVAWLSKAQHVLDQYSEVSPETRRELRDDLYASLTSLYNECRSQASRATKLASLHAFHDDDENGLDSEAIAPTYSLPIKKENLLYEDRASLGRAYYKAEGTQLLVEKLEDLVKQLSLFEGGQEEKLKIRTFYKNFCSNNEPVNLINFLESYYTNIVFDNNIYSSQKNKQAYKLSFDGLLTEKRAAQSMWLNEFRKLVDVKLKNMEEELHISSFELKAINTQLEVDTTKPGKTSYGAFLQIYAPGDGGKLKAVLNGFCAGYGKLFSRFLTLFDPSFARGVFHYNTKLSGNNSLLVENCDASSFNGNLHPPMLGYEISIPGGSNSMPQDRQILASDLLVTSEDSSDELVLVHAKTGQKVNTLDLGFESITSRSKLFQLLEQFTIARHYTVLVLNRAIRSMVKALSVDASVVVCPRVVFDDAIVIHRKSWFVNNQTLLSVLEKGADSEFFKNINLWRATHHIPDRVFFSIAPRRHEMPKSSANEKRHGRDDYKPQFIDFNNPLLIKLLEKMLVKAADEIRIEEMLPSSDLLKTIDGQQFVTEELIQW